LPEPTSIPVSTPKPVVATVPSSSGYDELYQRYADQFGIEKNAIASLAQCESGHRPEAVNGIYGGMFQYSSSTWASTRASMGLDTNPELRFHAEESIHTTAFKIANGGIRAWTNCARKYGLL
jgi:soluble lytic murein transglycosylase-like protein